MTDAAPAWAKYDAPDWAKAPAAPQEKPDFGGAATAFGKSAIKEGGRAAGAFAGGEVGAETGAAIGSFAGPIGAGVGGILGGLTGAGLGYYGANRLEKGPDSPEEIRHPLAKSLGALAVDVPTAGYGLYQTGRALAPAGLKLAKTALGVPSRSTEELAKQFEAKGFKLEPAQLKADVPSKSPGFAGNKVSNQTLANKLASETTGAAAPEGGITDKFLNSRFDALGKKYDDLIDRYPGWTINRAAYDKLGTLLVDEEHAATGAVRPVAKIAQDIRNEWQKTQTKFPGTQISSFRMDGTQLKRYLSELKKIARSSSDGTDKYAASEAIRAITDSLADTQPKLASELKAINQQYRSTVALDEMLKSGNIRGGNISLSKLGDRIKYLEGNPLYELGLGGRELNLAARWEGAGQAKSISPETLLSPSKLARTLGTYLGLRTQAARNIQRGFTGD